MFWLTILAVSLLTIGTVLFWYGSTRDENINEEGSGILIAAFGSVLFIIGALLFIFDVAIRLYS